MRLLLDKNARVNVKARNGWTAVNYAQAGDHTAIAGVLRQALARQNKWEAAHPRSTPAGKKQAAQTIVPNSPLPSPNSVTNGSIIILR